MLTHALARVVSPGWLTALAAASIGTTLIAAVRSFGQTVTQELATVELATLTNVFLTADDFEFAAKGMKKAYIDRARLAEALRSEESWPEDKGPEGNWGPASEGFRVSLRFERVEYHQGEPISATILVRNVSRQELEYDRWFTDWDFQFDVYDAQKRKLQDLPTGPQGSLGSKAFVVYPRTQRRFRIRLDPHVKLDAPGEYSVTVRTRVPRLGDLGQNEISSGTAHIKIVSPPQANPPDRPANERHGER